MKQIIVKACWDCPYITIDKYCKLYRFFIDEKDWGIDKIDSRCRLGEIIKLHEIYNKDEKNKRGYR